MLDNATLLLVGFQVGEPYNLNANLFPQICESNRRFKHRKKGIHLDRTSRKTGFAPNFNVVSEIKPSASRVTYIISFFFTELTILALNTFPLIRVHDRGLFLKLHAAWMP